MVRLKFFLRYKKMNNWKETTLDKAIELVGGGTPRTSIDGYWNGGIPWLSVVDFNNNSRWVEKTEKSITEHGLKNSSTKLLNVGDLIISARGTVGELAQLKKTMAFNQSCYGIKANKDSDVNFLYYFIKWKIKNIKKNVHGAVFDTITRNTFEKIDILLPSLPEQKEIAAVLSSLDDKIELLRKQNETLEKIAQGIFKEWFVNFKIDGKKLKLKNGIPEGWRVGKLTDIADFLNGFAMQKFPSESKIDYLPVIKIKEMNSGITDQTDKASKNIPEKYVVNNGDILFSWSGSLDIDIWKYGKGALNQHLFKVTSGKYPKWFYFYWIKYHLPNFRQVANAKAVTMGHIQRHHLDDARVVIPDNENLKKSDMLIEPIFEKTILNNSQIQTLSRLRDTLLPKLMSGEVKAK